MKKARRSKKVRVRFAPSPTGNLHLGGARTALFNFIFARQKKGTFILRIEDTDKERSKPEFTKDILDQLKWLNLNWDEGPIFQSKRGELYKSSIEKLLKKGLAYYCFCSKEALRQLREHQLQRGQPPCYPGICRTISLTQAIKRLEKGEKAIVRLKVGERQLSFNDLIRGQVKFNTSLLGDFSLAKVQNGEIWPLYNFAAAVDDIEMQISHIIRGEDHISNTPKQILIQEALGFSSPLFAHLPLILGPDRSKMSKRHGAVAIAEYRKMGFLPEALINFLALLGWNPGTDKEIFSLEELIEEFSFERVHKSGAVFNRQKLEFLNGVYIRKKNPEQLLKLCLPYLQKFFNLKGIQKETLIKIISLYQERLKVLSELPNLVDYFFVKYPEYEPETLLWKDASLKDTKNVLINIREILKALPKKEWRVSQIRYLMLQEADKLGDRGKVLWPSRVALTGKKASAPFFEIAEILGKEKTLERLDFAISKLDQKLAPQNY